MTVDDLQRSYAAGYLKQQGSFETVVASTIAARAGWFGHCGWRKSMRTRGWLGVLLPILLCPVAGFAQQVTPLAQPAAGPQKIYLDVVVSPKGGAPVAKLGQQDFTVFDNKAPQTITSFRALGGEAAPVEVILVIDAVNTSYQTVAYERGEIDKFLRANGGHLAYPTTLVIMTDTSTQIQNGFSKDGNRIANALEQYAIGLRSLTRSSGVYGASDRVQISIKALRLLATDEAALPGRKIVLWMSPGWPLLTGPGIELGPKQQQSIFDTVVSISAELRQARITLYSIDPRGASDAGTSRLFYYQGFLKGIHKPSQTDIADMGLQVIATQTGGLALNSSNDLAGLLQRCMADTNAYYELSFDPPPGDQPNEYHQLEVRVAKPGLIARTRNGYYSQP
jgi:VWFA-related protein